MASAAIRSGWKVVDERREPDTRLAHGMLQDENEWQASI